MSLFDDHDLPEPSATGAPLADRMRPQTLDELIGQERLVGPGTALRHAIERDELHSILFWGPPGSGKTTLARIIARRSHAAFVPFSAVLSGIKEVRQVMEHAARTRRAGGRRTIVFIDEIHRFNKAQQDAFLPYLEAGTVVLIGATTENPSFEVNAALLSRSRVYRLERLTEPQLVELLRRALEDPVRGLGGRGISTAEGVLEAIAAQSQGDARAALNVLELAAQAAAGGDAAAGGTVGVDLVRDVLQRATLYHDRAGEEHFNLISAFHKSMRNSDADATLYWLGRMLEAGEDPLYVARRIVRFASEDVGLADPGALSLAMAAQAAFHFTGLPEGELALAEAAVYCALAPKSNALYRAWGAVQGVIRAGVTDPVPLALRNAPTPLMEREGYGEGYRYAHDFDDAVTDMDCLPDRLSGQRFYQPGSRGLEAELAARIERWHARRRSRGGGGGGGGGPDA